MSESSLPNLIARVDRLERQNRRLRWIVAAIVVLVAAGTVTWSGIDAVSQGRTVEAERFVLRRADGSTAGAFGTTQAGAVNLVLLDRQNRARATVGINAEGNPGVVLISPTGRQRVTLADSPQGSAILVFDNDGKVRWAASVDASGRPAIEFHDAQGKTVWKQQ